jgi:hypothetical protein
MISQVRNWSICGGVFRLKENSDLEQMGKLHHQIWSTCAALVNRFVGPIREY